MVNSVIDSPLADMKLYTQTAVFLFDDHQRCLLFSRYVNSIDVSKVALTRLLGRAATRAIPFCGRFASVACDKFIQIAIALKKRKKFFSCSLQPQVPIRQHVSARVFPRVTIEECASMPLKPPLLHALSHRNLLLSWCR